MRICRFLPRGNVAAATHNRGNFTVFYCFVHHIVVTVPTCGVVVGGIYEKKHPVVVFARRGIVLCFDIKINAVGCNGNFRENYVVASQFVSIAKPAVSAVRAVCYITFGIAILSLDFFPCGRVGF